MRVIEDYLYELKEINPDLILSSNPYGPNENYIVEAANNLNIPSISVISSWDNLGYLGPIIPKYSNYIVWGEMMKNELLESDNKIKPNTIYECSSIQFDFHYKNFHTYEEKNIRQSLGIDNLYPVLLYTANTEYVFPEETIFVNEFCNKIANGVLGLKANIILRLHPNDNTNRFNFLSQKYSFLIIQRPWKINKDHFWWFEPSKKRNRFSFKNAFIMRYKYIRVVYICHRLINS